MFTVVFRHEREQVKGLPLEKSQGNLIVIRKKGLTLRTQAEYI